MGRIINWAQLEVPNITEEQAEKGAQYAKSIAPEQTGALIQAIDVKPGRGRDSSRYTIVSRTPKKNPNWYGETVPYQVFLHKGLRGGYRGATKTGDHEYMYTTASILRKGYPRKVQNSLAKILKSGNFKIK